MVLLAAAVCLKSGKVIFSRQFMDMNKPRIDSLLSTFPKLIMPGKQHTFIETESVRYVYQPLDKLYMLLITTKTSNILEDLETLRLFSKVIPEYCKNMSEADVLDNVFYLIAAFDEIVALGYRENVNLSQIKTFTEMDSHEEKVFQAVRQNQEREANENMKRKAKELTLAKKEAIKRGVGNPYKTTSTNISSKKETSSDYDNLSMNGFNKYATPSSYKSQTTVNSKAMKLGGKQKEMEQFVEKLVSEGQEISKLPGEMENLKINHLLHHEKVNKRDSEKISISMEEKISVCVDKDGGGIEKFDINGILLFRINDESFGKLKVLIDNPTSTSHSNKTDGTKENILSNLRTPLQLQCHPNIDKKSFTCDSVIRLKDASKSFPLNMDVGVLKWHLSNFQNPSQFLPLIITCWPSEGNDGTCEVNVEYTLNKEDLELKDVAIIIPLPNCKNVVINECSEGDYEKHIRVGGHNNNLTWNIPLLNARSNKTGTLEFVVTSQDGVKSGGMSHEFFPINVEFSCNSILSSSNDTTYGSDVDSGMGEGISKPYLDIKIIEVNRTLPDETEELVKYSSEYQLNVEKYEIT